MSFESVDDVLVTTRSVRRRVRGLSARGGLHFVLALVRPNTVERASRTGTVTPRTGDRGSSSAPHIGSHIFVQQIHLAHRDLTI